MDTAILCKPPSANMPTGKLLRYSISPFVSIRTCENPNGVYPHIKSLNVGVDGVVELGSRAKSMLRKQPSGSGRRKHDQWHGSWSRDVNVRKTQCPQGKTSRFQQTSTVLSQTITAVLPQASGSSPMLPEGSATSTSIAKEKSSRGETMVRWNVTRKAQYRNDGMYRRGKLPPRTNGGTVTSTEAREFSNATKVSSRSTTRSASTVATRTQRAQQDAPRRERSEQHVQDNSENMPSFFRWDQKTKSKKSKNDFH